MIEKAGRNDPCPCGSGKKYKQCCLKKDMAASIPGTKKFKAKIISAGGAHKQKEQESEESRSEAAIMNQAALDYNTLMERSFGNAIHGNHDDLPPIPSNPSEFIEKKDS